MIKPVHRSWLDQYPPGVRHEIDLGEFASLNEMFARTCRDHPDSVAWEHLGRAITYGELDRLSRDFAAFLQSLGGLAPGSRVAIMLPNILQYPVVLFAVLRAGFTIVNVNPLYTARELENQLVETGVEVLIVLENVAHTAAAAGERVNIRHVVVTGVGDLLPLPRRHIVNFMLRRVRKLVPRWKIPGAIRFRAALRRGAASRLREANPAHDDIAVLQYTGGTTGVSKGAILTHGNLLANVLQIYEPGRDILEPDWRWMAVLPLYHIAGFIGALVQTKIAGRSLLIIDPRDLRTLVQQFRAWRPHAISGVNTLFNALLTTPGFDEIDFTNLKSVMGGAAAVHPAVAERWQAVTGCPITQAYGLSETSGVVSANLPHVGFNGTVGLPLPSTEVSIRDEDGRELPAGCAGEICVRGAQVTQGYWRRPEETAAAFFEGGWFRTGDIGTLDEQGYLRITDRKKEMINVSGFKVFPSEVESVIAEIPGVVECGVIGAPDDLGGEVVKAVIKRNSDDVTAERVIAYCRGRLTGYKVPKQIEFRSDLPKSPIGKVLRRELREASCGRGQ